MVQVNNFYFLQDVGSPVISQESHNTTGETMTLQFEGSATAFSCNVLGCSDLVSDDYYILSGFDVDFSMVNAITKKSIYTFGVEGISKIKVQLTSIGGGTLSVFARITKGV